MFFTFFTKSSKAIQKCFFPFNFFGSVLLIRHCSVTLRPEMVNLTITFTTQGHYPPTTSPPCWSLHAFMWVLGVSAGFRCLGAICHWDEVLTELEAPSHASRRESSLKSTCEDVYTQSILMRLRTERQSLTHTGNTHIH